MNLSHRTTGALAQAAQRAAGVQTGHTEVVRPDTPTEADLGTMMALLAYREGQKRRTVTQPVHDRPSPSQLKVLQALKGSMTANAIADILGMKGHQVSGFLSGLCVKGFTERVGYEGQKAIWRRTRKGCKWTA